MKLAEIIARQESEKLDWISDVLPTISKLRLLDVTEINGFDFDIKGQSKEEYSKLFTFHSAINDIEKEKTGSGMLLFVELARKNLKDFRYLNYILNELEDKANKRLTLDSK